MHVLFLATINLIKAEFHHIRSFMFLTVSVVGILTPSLQRGMVVAFPLQKII